MVLWRAVGNIETYIYCLRDECSVENSWNAQIYAFFPVGPSEEEVCSDYSIRDTTIQNVQLYVQCKIKMYISGLNLNV